MSVKTMTIKNELKSFDLDLMIAYENTIIEEAKNSESILLAQTGSFGDNGSFKFGSWRLPIKQRIGAKTVLNTNTGEIITGGATTRREHVLERLKGMRHSDPVEIREEDFEAYESAQNFISLELTSAINGVIEQWDVEVYENLYKKGFELEQGADGIVLSALTEPEVSQLIFNQIAEMKSINNDEKESLRVQDLTIIGSPLLTAKLANNISRLGVEIGFTAYTTGFIPHGMINGVRYIESQRMARNADIHWMIISANNPWGTFARKQRMRNWIDVMPGTAGNTLIYVIHETSKNAINVLATDKNGLAWTAIYPNETALDTEIVHSDFIRIGTAATFGVADAQSETFEDQY